MSAIAAAALCRGPSTLARDSADRVVLLPADDEGPLILSGPAAVAWKLLGDPMPPAALAEALASLYAVEVAAVTAQIQPVLDALVRRGALQVLA